MVRLGECELTITQLLTNEFQFQYGAIGRF